MKYRIPVAYTVRLWHEVEANSEAEALTKTEAEIEAGDFLKIRLEDTGGDPDSLTVDYMNLGENFSLV